MMPLPNGPDCLGEAQSGCTQSGPHRRSQSVLLHALLLTALLAGCRLLPAPQADPAHFYALGEKTPAAAQTVTGTLRIGLRPVELPSYLQTRAMVVRVGSEIRYEQNRRWAEPLDEAVARIVRTHLLATPTVATVYPTPFPIGEPRDYDVTLRVQRCEGARDATGKAVALFAATIEITRADTGRAVVLRRNISPPGAAWDGKDFSVLANLLGDAVAALRPEIAGALPTAK